MKRESLWGTPLDRPTLEPDEVHVWCARLDPTDSGGERLTAVLSLEERARAKRFHFERDARRFTAGRAILRRVLGLYLGLQPERLAFAYGPHGKPQLAIGSGDGRLRFNLSHSGGLGLIAVARDNEVGVDLECVRPILDFEEIADRNFSPRENAALRALPADQRERAFFNCWTQKEAYLKALGDGLARPLGAFAVSVGLDEPAQLLWVSDDPEEPSRWSLTTLTPARDVIGALAVPAHGARVVCWQWLGESSDDTERDRRRLAVNGPSHTAAES